MPTRYPITIEGNLTHDPSYGESDNGYKYAKFTVAVTERRQENGVWVDGATQFHRATAFGRTAQNVRDSLSKGDAVIVTGNLEFRQWNDQETGEAKSSTEVVADAVGPSLRFAPAIPRRGPNAPSEIAAPHTGPTAVPAESSSVGRSI
jgi:single-strand DNA-binding protein